MPHTDELLHRGHGTYDVVSIQLALGGHQVESLPVYY